MTHDQGTMGAPRLTRDASARETGESGEIKKMKYVFVCGMPRSGTTILAKEIAGFADCTGFENTGVMMDEGQYLQDVYPTEWACGGAGRFGFDSRAHLTEHSPLLAPDKVDRLRQSWQKHWDRNKTICVEKSPGNLLKTRFLQAAFPNAYFLVIKRHPVAVSLATQKWSLTPLHELFKHWLQCHKIFDEDKQKLDRLYELSYEDYIENPGKHLEEIAKFIGTEFSGSLKEQSGDSYNKKYFDRWARMLRSSPFKAYCSQVAEEYEGKFREHGYSLAPPSPEVRLRSHEVEPRRSFSARLLYPGAASFFALWRAGRELRMRVENAPVFRPWIPSVKRAIRRELKRAN